MKTLTWDVVVIGAGMAGLAAARTLAEAGLRVLVLEARQRVGGRIFTRRVGGEIVELGAEFVHGRPPELWALIEEAGLDTYERTGEFFDFADGRLTSNADDEDEADARMDVVEELKHFTGADMPFAEYVAGMEADAQAEAVGYVEGFNATDAREASIVALGRQQVAEDAIEGDLVFRVREGYDRVPAFLRERVEAAGGTVELGARVIDVVWERGQVTVRCGDGREFVAAKAVITLPLGVLQAGRIRFDPKPLRVLEAAGRMRMGHASRFTLRFKQQLWPQTMSFLMARESMPSVWWTARSSASLTMTGWAGGPRSAALAERNTEELQSLGCRALAEALGLNVDEVTAQLAGVERHEWREDEYALGAYSWVPVGGLDASAEMAVPVEETLFFAGEHTDTTGHWGTVHAALRSGLRAAKQVLAVNSTE